MFVWEEPGLNGKEAVGCPKAGELIFYFMSYRIDDLRGERLDNVMLKVTGGVIIRVFEEKIELQWMEWSGS